jgi:hypothetical protein
MADWRPEQNTRIIAAIVALVIIGLIALVAIRGG